MYPPKLLIEIQALSAVIKRWSHCQHHLYNDAVVSSYGINSAWIMHMKRQCSRIYGSGCCFFFSSASPDLIALSIPPLSLCRSSIITDNTVSLKCQNLINAGLTGNLDDPWHATHEQRTALVMNGGKYEATSWLLLSKSPRIRAAWKEVRFSFKLSHSNLAWICWEVLPSP